MAQLSAKALIKRYRQRSVVDGACLQGVVAHERVLGRVGCGAVHASDGRCRVGALDGCMRCVRATPFGVAVRIGVAGVGVQRRFRVGLGGLSHASC